MSIFSKYSFQCCTYTFRCNATLYRFHQILYVKSDVWLYIRKRRYHESNNYTFIHIYIYIYSLYASQFRTLARASTTFGNVLISSVLYETFASSTKILAITVLVLPLARRTRRGSSKFGRTNWFWNERFSSHSRYVQLKIIKLKITRSSLLLFNLLLWNDVPRTLRIFRPELQRFLSVLSIFKQTISLLLLNNF